MEKEKNQRNHSKTLPRTEEYEFFRPKGSNNVQQNRQSISKPGHINAKFGNKRKKGILQASKEVTYSELSSECLTEVKRQMKQSPENSKRNNFISSQSIHVKNTL